jgi:hypothetical protein
MMQCRNCGRRIVDGQTYMHDGPFWVHVSCPVKPGPGAMCERIRDGEPATPEGYHVRCPNITNLGKFH